MTCKGFGCWLLQRWHLLEADGKVAMGGHFKVGLLLLLVDRGAG